MKTIQLDTGEEIVLVLRRHWFVILREFVAIACLLLFGILLYSFRFAAGDFIDPDIFLPLTSLLFSIFLLALLAISFALWINYHLDVWIVTTKRIIDIEQRGLFNREVSEFLITNVQDITIRTPNFISTVLKFGNMTIQTSGAQNFLVRDIPNAESAKEIILRYCHSTKPLNQDLGIMNKEATLKNS